MKTRKFILTLCTILMSLIVICITSVSLILSDNNMNSKQGLPDFENTTLNFEGYDIKNSYLKQHMIGEYEFYYNKFIVSDSYKGDYDAIVKVPHHYKDTIINNKKLTNAGYASYKCYVKGLPIGTKIWFINNNFVGSFYAYINNELVLKYGTHNKKGNAKSNGGDDLTLEYVIKDESTLEVVFEVGSSLQGGLTSPARLIINTLGRNPTSQYLTNNIGFVVLGLVIGLLIFSLIININITYRDFAFFIFMILITLMTFFSIDVYWRFLSFSKLNTYNHVIFIDLLLSITISFSLYFLLTKKEYIKKNNNYYIVFGINDILNIILYFLLMGTFYQVIPLMFSLINYILILICLVTNLNKDTLINIPFILIIASLILYFNVTFFDLENIMIAGLEQSISYIMLPIIIIIIFLYRISTIKITRKYIKLLESEKQSLIIKAESLKNQIKPHYIFNLLTSIEYAYNKDITIGEEMLTRFSKYLRNNIEHDSEELTPISQEIDTILNYIELESLRNNKEIPLLLNIEDDNFNIPSLSIQVFIENSIKHSKIETKEDGFISLSTYKKENNFIIEIKDNGVGFDLNDIKNQSIGIKNATERIKILVNGEINISSNINQGTEVVIKIPRKEKVWK